MNEISTNTEAVVCRGGARFVLSKQSSEQVKNIITSNNAPKFIKIGDALVAVSDIILVAPANQIEEIYKEKRGEWKCASGNWHKRGEVCKCGWGGSAKTEVKDEELSADQKERGLLIKTALEQGSKLSKLAKMTNEELREATGV